jgi:hypothetical protein
MPARRGGVQQIAVPTHQTPLTKHCLMHIVHNCMRPVFHNSLDAKHLTSKTGPEKNFVHMHNASAGGVQTAEFSRWRDLFNPAHLPHLESASSPTQGLLTRFLVVVRSESFRGGSLGLVSSQGGP